MGTLNKQADQAVQLQRLSEWAPFGGDATVWTHGNAEP